MTVVQTDIEQLSIDTIRTLAMDAVQKAASGHPGTPMAMAPVAYQLWHYYMSFDPSHPIWPARDRFVLSCGHASMLLYAVLHLTGVQQVDEDGEPTGQLAIGLDDIKNFRQLHSPCAGHPEFGEAPGIETTTGPLGQGCANSVGMAISAKWLAARYNRPTYELFDYNVYVLCSDGDLMEGISFEAASLAGHLALSNLCWIYDHNELTIDGSTDLTFSEDVGRRFEALGWNVVTVADANDRVSIGKAIEEFQRTHDRPTLVLVRSIIAYGAPNKQGTAAAHGAPLGDDEVKLAKEHYEWPHHEPFSVPAEVPEHFAAGVGTRGASAYQNWVDGWRRYEAEHVQLAEQLKMLWRGELPAGWDDDLPVFSSDDKPLATRSSSGKVLNAAAANIPWLVGGSADLAGSNMSLINDPDAGHFGPDNYGGRNVHFGIREHAMAAIANGMALSGLRSYAATFFVFTDYMRPAIRLAALARQNVVYLLTHDSIGLGEDGPTHQPIEHLAACRAIPGLVVLRPADANEVTFAYRAALSLRGQPAALILTRQKVPTLDRNGLGSAEGTLRGAYVLVDAKAPNVILIGTGSELQLCIRAAERLGEQNISARVVSMPSWELFEQQDDAYRQTVLPSAIDARVAVEAGIRQGWDRYIGRNGQFVGMNSFGASAPAERLYEHFDITVDAVVKAAKRAIDGRHSGPRDHARNSAP